MTSLIVSILAGVAGVAAFAFYLRVRGLGVELGQSGVENEKLRAELQSSRAQLERIQAKQRRGSDELVELRKKLEKSKRRAARAQDAGHGATASQVQALEADLEQTRQARDAARDEASGLSSALSRARAEAAQVEAPPGPETPSLDNAGIEALRGRCERAEAALAAARPELAAMEKSNARLKGRIDTQERLYVSIRSELEAKKDRLRTQQEEIERLQALKVALVDPLPPETPIASARPETDEPPKPA
ncbi:MAG: hypothetical protein JRE70_15945 [Deltaproteobacteria bacterium]|nr:hypothetical protein [Deltaproteobacteria bacterium]